MLFGERKSALVRLSDTLKVGLLGCQDTTLEILDVFRPHAAAYAEAREWASRALAGEVPEGEAEGRIRAVLSSVPPEDALHGAQLQQVLHSQALSTTLGCCFCLESYINSLAYFLFEETDFLGLVRDGHKSSAEVLLEAIKKMGTLDKWTTVARLRGSGFDAGKPPFQDFKVLFRFRDDHVHSKVVELSDDFSQTRYGGRLPDPVFGTLELHHALYGAETYWKMAQEVHRLLGVEPRAFQRHYNLAPWQSEDSHVQLNATAQQFLREFRGKRH